MVIHGRAGGAGVIVMPFTTRGMHSHGGRRWLRELKKLPVRTPHINDGRRIRPEILDTLAKQESALVPFTKDGGLAPAIHGYTQPLPETGFLFSTDSATVRID